MAVPRHRHTKSKVHKRRMHIYLTPAALVSCPKCGKLVRPHTMCQSCGYYKGREVVDVMAKLTKKERKQKEKDIKEQEHGKGKEAPMTMEELSKK